MNINLINNYVGPTKGYHWVESWLFSTNCQNISILYGIFSLFSGLVGLSLSVLMRIELSSPNPQILMHNGQLWNVLITAHALFMGARLIIFVFTFLLMLVFIIYTIIAWYNRKVKSFILGNYYIEAIIIFIQRWIQILNIPYFIFIVGIIINNKLINHSIKFLFLIFLNLAKESIDRFTNLFTLVKFIENIIFIFIKKIIMVINLGTINWIKWLLPFSTIFDFIVPLLFKLAKNKGLMQGLKDSYTHLYIKIWSPKDINQNFIYGNGGENLAIINIKPILKVDYYYIKSNLNLPNLEYLITPVIKTNKFDYNQIIAILIKNEFIRYRKNKKNSGLTIILRGRYKSNLINRSYNDILYYYNNINKKLTYLFNKSNGYKNKKNIKYILLLLEESLVLTLARKYKLNTMKKVYDKFKLG